MACSLKDFLALDLATHARARCGVCRAPLREVLPACYLAARGAACAACYGAALGSVVERHAAKWGQRSAARAGPG